MLIEKTWQDKYDDIANQIKSLNAEKKSLVDQVESQGFFFKNGKITSDEIVVGVIKKWAYYSRYVGEKGALYDYEESAYVFRKDMTEIIASWKQLEEKSQKGAIVLLEEYYKFFSYFEDEFDGPGELELPDADSRTQWPYRDLPLDKILNEIKKDCERYFDMFSYDGVSMKFRYAGDSDQGELVNDSGFTIGPYDKKFIEKYKSESLNDEFDAFDDEVEW